MPHPISRGSVRAPVIDEAGRVLLSRVTALGTTAGVNLWVTLGGRLKEGETLFDALARELAEELGMGQNVIGPEVWLGDEVVNWGGKEVRLVEHFFLVLLPAADYAFIGEDQEEVTSIHELQWWHPDEIRASADRFVPCDLGSLLGELADRPPPLRKHVRLEGAV